MSRTYQKAGTKPHRFWNPDVKLTTADEMRDRIIGALDPRPRS